SAPSPRRRSWRNRKSWRSAGAAARSSPRKVPAQPERPAAPEPPWKRVLKRYLEGLTVERGLSQNSVDAYRRDLERLARALDRPQVEGGPALLTARPPTPGAHH